MDAAVARSFGERNFGGVYLGDKRRTARVVQLVDSIIRHPGGTLPDKLAEPPELRAFYGLMNRKEVTHNVLMESHAQHTREKIAEVRGGVVLVLHDATELDYTTRREAASRMGQIGQGTRRGYICHNSLAVRADTGETLGLTSQILHHRANVPKNESKKACREREDRESRLWIQGATQSGPAPAGVLVVDISDSLSDTFEYMASEVTNGRHFVLRAREDRKLAQPLRGHNYLYGALCALKPVATRTLVVQESTGRSARTTTVKVAYSRIVLNRPGKKSGDYDHKQLELWGIRVWEPNTPPDEEPLEWRLLTDVPVGCVADAHERIDWYERRPIVEELHKGMKTGCSIESMQFDLIERLEPAIAIVSVVATALLQLRDAARAPDADKRKATEVVDIEYVAVLVAHYQPKHKMSRNPSVKEFYMFVARLGGHQNRKGDGFPGWITLWRGWTKLQSMVDGYRAARRAEKRSGKT